MNQCTVEGCNKVVVARNYCATHYKRFKRHGDATKGRPATWGKTYNHPMYESYYWFKRNNLLSQEIKEFWDFVKIIGEKPHGHKLYRIDIHKPLSINNFEWRQSIISKEKAEYARKWRAANPEKSKNNYLKKCYGITLEQYNEMLIKQNGVCAICCEKDPNFDNLAVDHDHKTNKVRGLLCHLCNRALGMFKDDGIRIKNAIIYLNAKK